MEFIIYALVWSGLGWFFAWFTSCLEFGSFCNRWPLYSSRKDSEAAKLRKGLTPWSLLGPLGIFSVFGTVLGQGICGNEICFKNIFESK